MERVPAQSLKWRLFTLVVALILAVVSLARPASPMNGGMFESARTIYWLLAPIGLLGYAFGFRIIGVTFWRFYAVIFSVEMALRFVRLFLAPSSHPPGLVAVVFLATVIMCVALLRHANLLRGGNRKNIAAAQVVRTRPATPGLQSPRQGLPPDGTASAGLNYRRGKLACLGLLFLGLGVVAVLISQGPMDQRGIGRLLPLILGTDGARIFMAASAILMSIGALRVLWLAFEGPLAVQIEAGGIRVRSIYFSGRVPWSSVRTVERRAVTGWGKHHLLVITRAEEPRLQNRLLGLGNKIVVQRNLLDARDEAVDAWIERARQGGRSVQVGHAASQPIPPTQRLFGRRQN